MVKAEFFYVENGLVASTDLGWLQSALNTLKRLFDQVGLRTNTRKTVGVVCKPYWASGARSDEAYTRWMTG